MNYSLGRSESMKNPSSGEGSFVGRDYHRHYNQPPYLPHPIDYHNATPSNTSLQMNPYGMGYPGYEMNGYNGPPSSFDSNSSTHNPISGPVPHQQPQGYMAPYPPYFPPWSVVPPPRLIVDITPEE